MPIYQFLGESFQFERYPKTSNRSLRPVSAADELLIQYLQDRTDNSQGLVIQHDRFGVLATVFADQNPQFIAAFNSQQKAMMHNLSLNKVLVPPTILSLLDQLQPTSLGAMRVPKSLQLFELYLAQFAWTAGQGEDMASATLVAGFMTRHFSPALLKIAERYAVTVTQSKAVKKARLLEISGFKSDSPKPEALFKTIDYQGRAYQQYYGVFSADHIDYATQFLLEFLAEHPLEIADDFTFLDLACGNGILASEVARLYPKAKGIAIDDFSLATSSVKKNTPPDRIQVLQDDSLDQLETASVDLIVSNPPFHFGHETNIEVSLSLFKQSARVLKPGGRLLIVANRHLNYSTHLRQLFSSVGTLSENAKFEILAARKAL